MAMAIVLPMSLYMDFFPAVVFLTSVYTGAGFGGSVPAILMNIPGSPSSFATTFDGYAMSKKGEHNEALGYALLLYALRHPRLSCCFSSSWSRWPTSCSGSARWRCSPSRSGACS